MGGRYGASDDGSSDYQDRRPDDDDRSDEQQTIADAVHAVADQQHSGETETTSGRADADSRSGGESGQHPFTTLRPGTTRTGKTTLRDVDQTIAEYVAEKLTGTVEEAVEKTAPDDTDTTE
jgi:hypothetical protein